jgi:O-antigen/teichoic acid export membrane protein
VLRRNWKFPLLETPSTILDNLAMNAPIFLVTEFYGLTATASFGLAFRGLAVPVSQISKTLTEVMQVRYSELQRIGEMRGLGQHFRKSTMAMAAGAVVAILCLMLVFAATSGSLPAGRVRQFAIVLLLIAPWVASSAVVNINSRLLLMLRRQELKLVYDVFGVANIGLLVVGHEVLSPSFYQFVALISAAQVLGYACYWFLLQHAVNAAEKGRTQAAARGSA